MCHMKYTTRSHKAEYRTVVQPCSPVKLIVESASAFCSATTIVFLAMIEFRKRLNSKMYKSDMSARTSGRGAVFQVHFASSVRSCIDVIQHRQPKQIDTQCPLFSKAGAVHCNGFDLDVLNSCCVNFYYNEQMYYIRAWRRPHWYAKYHRAHLSKLKCLHTWLVGTSKNGYISTHWCVFTLQMRVTVELHHLHRCIYTEIGWPIASRYACIVQFCFGVWRLIKSKYSICTSRLRRAPIHSSSFSSTAATLTVGSATMRSRRRFSIELNIVLARM